jgi:flagellar biosynthesis protein FliP
MRRFAAAAGTLVFFALCAGTAYARQAQGLPLPSVSLSFAQSADPAKVSSAMQVLIMMTVLSLAPAILMMVTSFVRIVVVLSFLRQALGTMQTPPNQVLIGLALFLTFFIMSPVITQIKAEAYQPYMEKKIDISTAYDKAAMPLKTFMLRQTREKDLGLFVGIAKLPQPRGPQDLPLEVVVPAFLISELKTAFQIGFMIYIPFLIIDLVVASVLLSMGMMMLPPVIISLPFKLMLFVMVDGWALVVGSLVNSFN